MKRRLSWLFLRIILTAGALAWFFSAVRPRELLDGLGRIRWGIAGLAFLVNSLWVLPSALRWKGLAKACGYPMRFGDTLRYSLIGSFFNAFLPTGTGGDVVRGFRASRDYGYPLGGMWGTILVERILGLMVSLFLVAVTGLVLFPKAAVPESVPFSAAVLLAGLAAACAFFISRTVRRLAGPVLKKVPFRLFREGIRDAARVADALRGNPRAAAQAVWLTFANQCIPVLGGFVLSSAIIGFQAPFAAVLFVIPLGFISMLLPSIGGYGVREAGTVLFFGWFGVGGQPAAVFGIMRLLFHWSFALAGGALYILGKKENGKKPVP
jgi:uncharacterized protein (TIRG00374 family)